MDIARPDAARRKRLRRGFSAGKTGRVERVLLRPGTIVTADSLILELSNPAPCSSSSRMPRCASRRRRPAWASGAPAAEGAAAAGSGDAGDKGLLAGRIRLQ
jgi:hypothetical protein